MLFNINDFCITTADLFTTVSYRVDFKVRGKAAEYFAARYGVGLNQELSVHICDGPQRMLLKDLDLDAELPLSPRDAKDVYSCIFLHEVPGKIRRFVENECTKRNLELADRTVNHGYEDLIYLYPNNYLRMHGLSPLRGKKSRRNDIELLTLNADLIQEKKPYYLFDLRRRNDELFYI